MAATRESANKREKRARRQLLVRENRHSAVPTSCESSVAWTEGVNEAHLASLLEQRRVELTNIVTLTPSEIHKTSLYSVVECRNKLIREHILDKYINM